MFSRLRRGWSIAQAGGLVIYDHPKLLLLPVLSGLAVIALVGAMATPFMALAALDADNTVLLYAVVLAAYIAGTFIVIFFNATLVFCALSCFHGQEPSLREGLAAAAGRSGQIFGWAVVAGTVCLLLNWLHETLKDNLGWLGSFLGVGLEVAWAATTYFVIPVVVVEGLGPIDAVKRSSEVLKQTWGEVVGAEAGVGIVGFILILPAVLLLVLVASLGEAATAIALVIGTLYIVAVSVVLAAVGTIFQTGAYLYAVSGQPPQGMEQGMFLNAFRRKS